MDAITMTPPSGSELEEFLKQVPWPGASPELYSWTIEVFQVNDLTVSCALCGTIACTVPLFLSGHCAHEGYVEADG